MPMYNFLYVINGDHSSKLLSFEKITFLHPDGQDIVEYPTAKSTNRWNYGIFTLAEQL